jgi:biofilm PGA synthesis N-glycosyltransferase PgaC
VGVFAYNEERSIQENLESILASRTSTVRIDEILVISSASTDRTDERVEQVSKHHPSIRLIRESAKKGKASAVNLFLQHARHECCALTNADTLLHEDAIESLCSPLHASSVGMVGGRIIPVGPIGGWPGFATELFWELHHQLCLRSPKMGELVAFRRVFDRLSGEVAGADEDWIHGEVLRHGLQGVYAPTAIVYSRGPSTLRDFIGHRHRLAVQHLVLKYRCNFSPASRQMRPLTRVTFGYLRRHPQRLPRVLTVAALEFAARVSAGASYFLRGETCKNWRPLSSSKGITRDDVERWRSRDAQSRRMTMDVLPE